MLAGLAVLLPLALPSVDKPTIEELVVPHSVLHPERLELWLLDQSFVVIEQGVQPNPVNVHSREVCSELQPLALRREQVRLGRRRAHLAPGAAVLLGLAELAEGCIVLLALDRIPQPMSD